MKPKTPHRVLAEKLCKKFPDTPSRTLAKRVSLECKVNMEMARTAVRTVRGVNGKFRREQTLDKSLFKPPGKAGAKPKLPPSLAKKWEPFEVGGGIRVGIL